MKANGSPAPSSAAPQTLDLVRSQVASILRSAPAFGKLSEPERLDLAKNMVKVATYMADPDGLARQELTAPNGGVLNKPSPSPLATPALARPLVGEKQAADIEETGKRFAGADFQAGAAQQGVEQFRNLVQSVDFPAFVGGLIKNVFQAIVDSSIQQMRAYGELLAAVSKSVQDYAQDHITENNARDWLTDKYPDQLGIDVSQAPGGLAETAAVPPQPTITVKEGVDAEELGKKITTDLQIKEPITDPADPDQQQRMVLAARLQIARSRQQLLASMVMLGINRIVVTDGSINAKVIFDMRAHDTARREATASQFDAQKQHFESETQASYSSWFSPVSVKTRTAYSQDHMATVSSSVSNVSTSDLDVKAKLSGEVRVNFKSDYFPMEKMANPAMIAAIQGNAKPLDVYGAPGTNTAQVAKT